jgi:hypothetical protein
VFALLDFALFAGLYGGAQGGFMPESWAQPLYAIEFLQNTPLNYTIFSYFILTKTMLLLATTALAVIMLLISTRFSKILHAFIANIIIIVALYAVYALKSNLFLGIVNRVNPLNLVFPLDEYRHYRVLNIFEAPVFEPAFNLICIGIFTILLIVFTTIKKQNVY